MEYDYIKQGNCLELIKDIPDDSIDLILTDPPYIISRETNFSSGEPTGKNTDRFRISMDFGTWDKVEMDFGATVKEFYRVLKQSGTVICFFDLWKITQLRGYMENANFKQIRFIEWLKTNPVPINSKINYLSNSREIALTGTKGSKPVFNSKYDNGIYKCPIFHGKDRTHPTQKPVSLMNELILKHTNCGDVVLDPFMGSGTTGVACVNTGRRFIGMELDGRYFETARQRIEKARKEHEEK